MTEPPEPAISPVLAQPVRLYGLSFWIAFVANFLLVAANTLIFRFSDFVVSLEGTAADAGLIIGLGTGVGVFVRIWMGRVVDRSGPRGMWIASGVALAASSFAFIPLRSLGPAIFFVRICYACGLAGVFSCSVIHLCTGVPANRRAELIGTLGTSGFIGAIIGPQLGDWIFRTAWLHERRFPVMFACAGTMVVIYLALVVFLTRHVEAPAPHESPPLIRLLVAYWPGTVVGVAMMMGMALTVPQTFLTLFREHQQLGGIGKFFWFYAPTAIFMRVVGRQWQERMGRRVAAVIGLAALTASMLLYLTVETEWDLAWSALAAGTGQALLFPSVTTLGAESFPERYRATGTSLILSFVDVGALCAAPALGGIIDRFGFTVMFFSSASVIAFVALIFSIASLFRVRRAEPTPAEPAIATEDELGEWS